MTRLLKIKRPGAPETENILCAFCPRAFWETNGKDYVCRCMISMEIKSYSGTSSRAGSALVSYVTECSGYEDAMAEIARNVDRDE